MDAKDIEAALKKSGKSKSGLARALSRTPATVSAILRGEREIKARELPLIAAYLNLEMANHPTPHRRPERDGELVDLADIPDETTQKMLKAGLQSRRQAEIWRLDTDLIEGTGYLPGDYLLVDLLQRPRPGDVVLAIRHEGRQEVPLFRAFYPPRLWFVTERALPPNSIVETVDNNKIIVRGVVVSRVR